MVEEGARSRVHWRDSFDKKKHTKKPDKMFKPNSRPNLFGLEHDKEGDVVPVKDFHASVEVDRQRFLQLELFRVVKNGTSVVLLLPGSPLVNALVPLHLQVWLEKLIVHVLIYLLMI